MDYSIRSKLNSWCNKRFTVKKEGKDKNKEITANQFNY